MSGAEMIAAERQRQVEAEGWTPEHDDEHDDGALVAAAIAYACLEIAPALTSEYERPSWPWAQSWWKPSDDPIRNLVKAGALIAAEIDRLARGQSTQAPSQPSTPSDRDVT